MKARNSARLAWLLWALSLGLVVGALVLALANRPDAPLYDYWLESMLINPTFATLGALIIVNRPHNVIGWIFLVPGVAGGLQFLAGQYATLALNAPASGLPGARWAALLSVLLAISAIGAVFFLILLFPTGSLLSRRWRIVVESGGLAIVVSLVSLALLPGPLPDFPSADPPNNPLGIDGTASLFEATSGFGGALFVVSFLAALASLVLRFRRSRGKERQQLKWFVYAAVLGFTLILFGSVLAPKTVDEQIGSVVWTLAPLGLPVSAGIAILKYRLYDIDVIINRTLVYGTLTALLGLSYFGLVVVLQQVFGPLTEGSDLAIAGSTLGVAALFRPARAGVQAFIDRRFYRRKYDASKTLERFATRLRDEIDIDSLSTELIGVVAQTLQPAHASLWLRSSSRDRAFLEM